MNTSAPPSPPSSTPTPSSPMPLVPSDAAQSQSRQTTRISHHFSSWRRRKRKTECHQRRTQSMASRRGCLGLRWCWGKFPCRPQSGPLHDSAQQRQQRNNPSFLGHSSSADPHTALSQLNTPWGGYEPSSLVNAKVYTASRIAAIDADEALGWTNEMVAALQAAAPGEGSDIASMLQTPIRRGVPDALKRLVFLRAQNARDMLQNTPNYYDFQLATTFGSQMPSSFDDRVPTFSGGFLGLEEEIQGSPLDVDRLEADLAFDVARSEISWTDLGAFCGQPPATTTPSRGINSSLSTISRDSLPPLGFDAPPTHMPGCHSTAPSSPYAGQLFPPVSDAPTSTASYSPLMSQDHEDVGLNYRSYVGRHPRGATGTHQFPRHRVSADTLHMLRSPHSPGDLQKQNLNPFPVGVSTFANRLAPPGESDEGSSDLQSRRASDSIATAWRRGSRLPTVLSCALHPQQSNTIASPNSVSHFNGFHIRHIHSDSVDLWHPQQPQCSCPQRELSEYRFDDNELPDDSASVPFSSRQEGSAPDVYRFESVTHLHRLLSPAGVMASKRLLWCLSNTFTDIEFCPLIPHLICICLIYLTEKETFFLLSQLFRVARQACQEAAARPFITYRRAEYVRTVKLAVAIAEKHLSRVTTHLSALRVDVAAWFAKTMADGLARAVPFNTLLRIYSTFLFEGSKVFQRYCLAILKVHSDQLLRCTTKDEAEKILHGPKHGSVAELNALTKTAFRLSIKWSRSGIQKYTSYDLPTPYLTGVKLQKFYRPRLNKASAILEDSEWEILWAWLPPHSRILDPSPSWRSTTDGMSLFALDRNVSKHHDRPMLCVLHTLDGEVLGCYSSKSFTLEKHKMDAIDPSPSFVFRLRPSRTAHYWTGANSFFIQFTAHDILIGNNGVAIYVNAAIRHGRSDASESFANPRLAGDESGDFVIVTMEVWTLH